MAKEKRREHRHTLRLATEVRLNEQPLDGMFRAHTENIGLTGAFLPAHALPLIPETDIELVLHAVTKPVPQKYQIRAEVVRTAESGAGLRFTELDPQQQKQFRRFLLEAKIAARQHNEA